MNYIVSILFCILLVGCSTPKVYLYKRYLSEDEVVKITNRLEKTGYKVETNTLAFPDEVQTSTILYSPFIKKQSSLDNFINEIHALGWTNTDIQPLVKGNHWYSKNSIGLLLIPEGVDIKDRMTSQDLVNQYTSDKCAISADLILKRDYTYQIKYQQEPDKPVAHKNGRWELTSYPYMLLTSSKGNWRFNLEIQRSAVTDLIGKINLLKLKPLSSHHVFPNCTFVFGIRE